MVDANMGAQANDAPTTHPPDQMKSRPCSANTTLTTYTITSRDGLRGFDYTPDGSGHVMVDNLHHGTRSWQTLEDARAQFRSLRSIGWA